MFEDVPALARATRYNRLAHREFHQEATVKAVAAVEAENRQEGENRKVHTVAK